MKDFVLTDFYCHPKLKTIRDSMQLDSGVELISLEGLVRGYKVRVMESTQGEVRVIFRDVVYKRASEMPKELVRCYRRHRNPERVALSDGGSYETPYYCDNNNWVEQGICVIDSDGNIVTESFTVIDIPDDNSPAGWRRCILEDVKAVLDEIV